MLISSRQRKQIEWIAAALVAAGISVWAGSPGEAAGWGVLCLAWLALAWTHGLSPLLVVGLTGLARSMPGVGELALRFYLASAAGVAAWAVSSLGLHKGWGAPAASILWGGAGGLAPGILPLCLSGFPRLCHIHSERSGRARWPGMVVLVGAWAAWIWFSGTPEALFRIREAAHYQGWAEEMAALFTSLTLWTALPLAGVFEFAQKQPDDIRTTWRNLPVFGMLACVCFLDAETGIGLFYLNALPLTALMLTRWTLALRSWIPRGLLWAGLAAHAWGLLSGGAV